MNLRDSLPILAVVLVLVGAFFLVDPLAIFSGPVEIPTHTFFRASESVDTYSILTADMIEKCQQSAEGVECTPAELDESSVFITRKAIVQGEELDRDAYTAVGDPWRPGRMDLEVISFRAEIDKVLGGTLRSGHKINIYGFRIGSGEDGPDPATLIADHVWVVDARTSTGGEVEARPAEEGDGAGGGIFGSSGFVPVSSGPASIVTVAVEPEIALQIIDALGAQQYQAWVTLSGPAPTPSPTAVTEEPTSPTPVPRPDLVVEDIITGPFPMVVNQPGTVQVRVKNQGSAEMATTCWVGLYIDRVAEAEPSKKMFCPPLRVGESAVISYTVTLADVGYHALTAWVDWLEVIPEEDETNNLYSVSVLLSEPTPTPTPTPTSPPPTPIPTSLPPTPTPTPTPTPSPTPTMQTRTTPTTPPPTPSPTMQTGTTPTTPPPTPTPMPPIPAPVIHLALQNTPYNWQCNVVFDDGESSVSATKAEIQGAGDAYERDFYTRELTLTIENVYPAGEAVWIVRTDMDERANVDIQGHAKDEEGRDLFRWGEDGTIVITLAEGATEATVELLDGGRGSEGAAGSALMGWSRPIASR